LDRTVKIAVARLISFTLARCIAGVSLAALVANRAIDRRLTHAAAVVAVVAKINLLTDRFRIRIDPALYLDAVVC
jgi:hypothetical protein